MSEEIDNTPRVGKNTGEVATFTDGTTANRQRPQMNPAFGRVCSDILSMTAFKKIFEVGLTAEEVIERLNNPAMRKGDDGGTGKPPVSVSVTPKIRR
ncbi:MAG TPA: hypothetical protein VFU48_11910 [Nitrospira sp.]|nr:hypothetical protein [Nitrospira sp.]